MKFPVKKEFTSYKIQLTVDEQNVLFGVGVDFKKAKNDSLFRTLKKLKGVIDVWFDFKDLDKDDCEIIIRINADKDTEKLWDKIHYNVDKYIKRGNLK